jgi:hypothetical protein
LADFAFKIFRPRQLPLHHASHTRVISDVVAVANDSRTSTDTRMPLQLAEGLAVRMVNAHKTVAYHRPSCPPTASPG